MAAYIASYFFGPKPVHFTDMYWRDQNKTVEVWTSENLPGRRSVSQDLYLLVGPSTFSAAEDFCYSLQQLKRATLVGEKTGGGAHMGAAFSDCLRFLRHSFPWGSLSIR